MDYKKAYDDKKSEFSALHERMKSDESLILMEDYQLKDSGGYKIPNSISVTLNKLAVFVTNVEAALGRMSESIVVESEVKEFKTTPAEDNWHKIFQAADDRLLQRGRFPLVQYIDQQTCRRGRVAVRCVVQEKEGKLDVDICPLDSLGITPSIDRDGLSWIGWEGEMTQDQILADYPTANVSAKSATVIDLWGRDGNEVYVAGAKAFQQSISFGFVPVVYQVVPMGMMDGLVVNQGESLIFLVRKQVTELQRIMSLIQTLNQRELDHALVWPSKDGTMLPDNTHDAITKPGTDTPVEIGGVPVPVYIGELRQQALWLVQEINSELQEGSLSKFFTGTFSQPMSAVAIIEANRGKDQVFWPRIDTRRLVKEQICQMIKREAEFISSSKLELNTLRGGVVDISLLKEKYTTSFMYQATDQSLDAARYQLAAASGLPKHIQYRDILQARDVDEIEEWDSWQIAGEISPSIRMLRTMALLAGRKVGPGILSEPETKLLELEMGITLDQLEQGNITQTPKPEQRVQSLMPLMGGNAQKSANLQSTPQEGTGG